MPFILPSGETSRIDYFNVFLENSALRIEYLLEGKLIATQEMSESTSRKLIPILLLTGDPGLYVAEMKFTINAQVIHSDSFDLRMDSTHVAIEHYHETDSVLKQRMTIETAKKIAEEISGSK